jgi:arsenite methyltransferase
MSHENLASTFDAWAQSGRADALESSHKPAVEAVLPQLEIKAGEKILDLGCGNGWATRLLARAAPGVQAIGLDVAPAMIARAEELHSYTIRARYEVGRFEALHFPDASFDRVFGMESLYYAVDLDQTLLEVRRVLKPTGAADFVIDFYAERPATRVWAAKMSVPMLFLSEAEWRQAFARNGFTSFETKRVVDPKGPGKEASFVPSEHAPDWATHVAMHAAGSLWMHATA